MEHGDKRVKQCIIIPIHPPKVNLLMACLSSISNHVDVESHPFKIVLATSNYAEYRYFNKMVSILPCLDLIEIMCVEDYIVDTLAYHDFADRYRSNEGRVIVNAKKFMAMHWAVHEGYEWIASVDSDMCAIRDLSGLFATLIHNYETAKYFGHSNSQDPRLTEINANCRKLFREADQEAIARLTKNDTTYAWFFDVPFYKRADLLAFFADMASGYDTLQGWLCRLDYFSFEHLVFLFWRCIRQQATLIDCFDMGLFNIPEYLNFNELMRIKSRHGYVPAWVQFREMLAEPDLAHALPDVSLLFHCDRV